MDNYKVIGLLGEGSFGRVYKAKQISDSRFVALKIISKRGRSIKEIKGLRRECEIQRHLHHPNIIQMLDSFETENEIVVITEFAHKELTLILSKEGYLAEERVQSIVWDLISALYYLHSHRVLHRDLKPQNILMDANNIAKLCDFGFARNMSTGTHVLTSIKGTPLYMAPELVEEHPYDHSADLWSLGCIIYELLVGAPPFCTTSILHLIRLIRHEQIQWPTFLSDNCISFLKGLLQKNPVKRLSWPDILRHPFIDGHVLISENIPSMSLTRPMSVNTLQAKEQQRKVHITQKNSAQLKTATSKNNETTDIATETTNSKKAKNPNVYLNLSINLEKAALDDKTEESAGIAEYNVNTSEISDMCNKPNKCTRTPEAAKACESNTEQEVKTCRSARSFNFDEVSHPLESEEWIVFLQRSMEEMMNGEMSSLLQSNFANIVVSPLRNNNATPKVMGYVANLLSLPFVVPGTSDGALAQIRKIYLDVKVIPNLVYASKLLVRQTSADFNKNTPTPTSTPTYLDMYRSVTELEDEELLALECIYLLICHLVHLDAQFLSQFCDAIHILNVAVLLQGLLLLDKRKLRIVIDVIVTLTHILQSLPENFELVEQVMLSSRNHNSDNEQATSVDFVRLLRHSNPLLRERVCYFLHYLGKNCKKNVKLFWNEEIRETLEALAFDSMQNVRTAAELTVEEAKTWPFYYNEVVNENNV